MSTEVTSGTDIADVSANETLKAESDGLMGSLPQELADTSTDRLSEGSLQILKFHGSYQQDDRDARRERKKQGLDRLWQFMVRTKLPGGRMTAEQYLVADRLAGDFGNDTLRITTRQDVQFHGVGKQNLRPLIRALNGEWMTTYGGCGDVVRNTLTCPVADLLPGHAYDYQALAARISDKFLPDSTSYYELWLDGEKLMADGERVPVKSQRGESFYGPTYMPRKHKMAIGLPRDNCVDVFTHDLSLESVLDADGTLLGFNLIAGGGLGSTNNKPETYPRLGDRIGFLTEDRVMEVLEAATSVYRDYGDRQNRRHARLKYVLAERGDAWFRAQVEDRLGGALADPAPVGEYSVDDHLGWQQQADGRWLVGLWVENGRVKDSPELALRTALREIVSAVRPELRLTAQQNLVLANISPEQRPLAEGLVALYGLSYGGGGLSELRRYAMACPALPSCGLAVAESERCLPDLIGELESRGYGHERVWIRMSGCPNACSRTPTAEIALVGRSLGLYNLYVGGSFEGTRLAKMYQRDVKLDALPDAISSVLDRWRSEGRQGEAFGDWASRELV